MNNKFFLFFITCFILLSCNISNTEKSRVEKESKAQVKDKITKEIGVFLGKSKEIKKDIDTIFDEVYSIIEEIDPNNKDKKKLDYNIHVQSAIEVGKKFHNEIEFISNSIEDLLKFTEKYKDDLNLEDKKELQEFISNLQVEIELIKKEDTKFRVFEHLHNKLHKHHNKGWKGIANFIGNSFKKGRDIAKELDTFLETVVEPSVQKISKILITIKSIALIVGIII